jgi:hypothetical protein
MLPTSCEPVRFFVWPAEAQEDANSSHNCFQIKFKLLEVSLPSG